MRIEVGIQQERFRSEHHKAFLNVIYLAGILRTEQVRMLKAFDISPEQYNVLRILRGQHLKAISVGDVQNRMLDRNSNASRLIDKLHLKKYVERRECPQDRRQMDIQITNSGLDLLTTIDACIERAEDKFSVLTEQEFALLNTMLDRITENYN